MSRTSFPTGIPHMHRLSGKANLTNTPQPIQQEILRHLSNFVSDLDKIGGIIEDARPHHAVIRRWRKLKFEMEGNLNDVLKIINNKETTDTTTLKPQNTRPANLNKTVSS
jgi:hypothetical protein